MPTIDKIDILKKFILKLILSFNTTKVIEKKITKDTKNLKFKKSLSNFKIISPTNIDGIHIMKNFLNSLYVLLSKDLFEKLIINRFKKLVTIDIGKRIKKISTILNLRISKNGVPRTKTPTPIID
jgi:hypothetical protein